MDEEARDGEVCEESTEKAQYRVSGLPRRAEQPLLGPQRRRLERERCSPEPPGGGRVYTDGEPGAQNGNPGLPGVQILEASAI